jgi:hypothetical protein
MRAGFVAVTVVVAIAGAGGGGLTGCQLAVEFDRSRLEAAEPAREAGAETGPSGDADAGAGADLDASPGPGAGSGADSSTDEDADADAGRPEDAAEDAHG